MSKATRVAPGLLLAGAIISAIGFVLAFTMAPLVHGAQVAPELVGDQLVANQLLFSQKIFYWHMPVALCSFLALCFTAYFGIRYLISRDEAYDRRACVATEIALVFIICTMATGVPWTRFEWGVWWTWEPRLTTYLVLMLLAIGYFVLRASFQNGERKAVYSSVFGIIVFLDAPLCFIITRLIPSSVHPVIFRTDSGLPPSMLIPLLLSLLGMLLVAYALFHLRVNQLGMSDRLAELKDQIDELE